MNVLHPTVCETSPKGSAVFSDPRRYRYQLNRVISDGDNFNMLFIMLNPSIAGAWDDDPTVRRCIAFAKREGFSSMTIVNLYALIATDPKMLKTNPHPIGSRNTAYIAEAIRDADLIVAAWGANADPARAACVLGMISAVGMSVTCLGVTKHGFPKHPLYLRASSKLVDYEQ